jgi:hypothetical protein
MRLLRVPPLSARFRKRCSRARLYDSHHTLGTEHTYLLHTLSSEPQRRQDGAWGKGRKAGSLKRRMGTAASVESSPMSSPAGRQRVRDLTGVPGEPRDRGRQERRVSAPAVVGDVCRTSLGRAPWAAERRDDCEDEVDLAEQLEQHRTFERSKSGQHTPHAPPVCPHPGLRVLTIPAFPLPPPAVGHRTQELRPSGANSSPGPVRRRPPHVPARLARPPRTQRQAASRLLAHRSPCTSCSKKRRACSRPSGSSWGRRARGSAGLLPRAGHRTPIASERGMGSN